MNNSLRWPRLLHRPFPVKQEVEATDGMEMEVKVLLQAAHLDRLEEEDPEEMEMNLCEPLPGQLLHSKRQPTHSLRRADPVLRTLLLMGAGAGEGAVLSP